jgi:hypothetical protein
MDELESALSRHLGRVTAPEALTLERATRFRPRTPRYQAERVTLWPVALAAAAVLTLCVFLAQPRSADLRSQDPAQIRGWLKARAFDIPLRADPPAALRLVSAHIKGPMAEIDYQVAGRAAVLTVSSPSVKPAVMEGYHVVRSHLVHGQLYTLSCAFPQDAGKACLLCHTGGQAD